MHRELIQLKCERTEHTNRIKGLFADVGKKVTIDNQLPTRLDRLRLWDGSRLPPALRERITREYERFQLVQAQIRALQAERARQIREDQSPQVWAFRENAVLQMGLLAPALASSRRKTDAVAGDRSQA